MSQVLVIGPVLHIQSPKGTSLIWWSAIGRLLEVSYLSLATVSRLGGRMNAPYNLWKSAGVISMNDAFIALIIFRDL